MSGESSELPVTLRQMSVAEPRPDAFCKSNDTLSHFLYSSFPWSRVGFFNEKQHKSFQEAGNNSVNRESRQPSFWKACYADSDFSSPSSSSYTSLSSPSQPPPPPPFLPVDAACQLGGTAQCHADVIYTSPCQRTAIESRQAADLWHADRIGIATHVWVSAFTQHLPGNRNVVGGQLVRCAWGWSSEVLSTLHDRVGRARAGWHHVKEIWKEREREVKLGGDKTEGHKRGGEGGETEHEIERAGWRKYGGLTGNRGGEDETWQDGVVFCSGSCDQGGKSVCLLSTCRRKQRNRDRRANSDKEPSVFLCSREKHKLLSVSRSDVSNVRGACLQSARGEQAWETFVHCLVATY